MNADSAREHLDWTPRRVWLRLKIPGVKTPGKTMMTILEPNESERAERLDELYSEECSGILLYAAFALNEIRLRDTESRPVLRDITEFLQFRCRVSDLDLTVDQKAIALENLSAANFPEQVDPSRPDSVVVYTVEALGALADHTENKAVTERGLRQLRDLMREAGKVASLAEYDPDIALVSFDEYAHSTELAFGDEYFPDSREGME